MDIIYEFWYNSCINESAPACISLHRTRIGANLALNEHKLGKERRFNDSVRLLGDDRLSTLSFGEHEEWGVDERKIFD